MRTNSLNKYVRARSLEAAQNAASLGNFIDHLPAIEQARKDGELYCVNVTIEAGDTHLVNDGRRCK